uniref:Uncharacterized protein n=1 Tax=Pyrodinium bahamense TaxID=73915 RepID=A0A7S0FBI5_9DINO
MAPAGGAVLEPVGPPAAEVNPPAAPGHPTHEVLNQATPLSGYNAYLCDPALHEGVAAHGGVWAHAVLEQFGAAVGSEEWQVRAAEANRYPPRLETHDRFGNRRDAAVYHPAYHQLMQLGLEAGAAAFAWAPEHAGRPGAHVARGALVHLMYQLDPGVSCPVTMSFAAVPALRQQRPEHDRGGLVAGLLAKLVARRYSGADAPLQHKPGATVGMSMTEKQGGSDVRANTTRASPATPGQEGPGDGFWLLGHKWFTSAPMCDAFLTLAQTKEGVSCFIVPRWLPDGSRNSGFTVQRLKDKLGDKSNASSEVEYREAWGVMLGPPGRGVRTIVDMVVHTRLDCVIGSAALMRLCAQHAAQHACGRKAFGRRLIEQPLMRAVLADLALESEAAVALWLRLAHALERAAEDESEAAFARLATAASKYYVCKRAPLVAAEAMECLGGNGYTEEWPMARLFRQSPLNAIWEGSGNVICLDVLRALQREPAAAAAVLRELEAAVGPAEAAVVACGQGNGYGRAVAALRQQLALRPEALEPMARAVVDGLAVCLQAAVLLGHGDPAVAQAFLATRLPASEGAAAASALPLLPCHSLGAMASGLPPAAVGRLLDRLLVAGGARGAGGCAAGLARL